MTRIIRRDQILSHYLSSVYETPLMNKCLSAERARKKITPEERRAIDVALNLERGVQGLVLLQALGYHPKDADVRGGQMVVFQGLNSLPEAYQNLTIAGEPFTHNATETIAVAQAVMDAASAKATDLARKIRSAAR